MGQPAALVQRDEATIQQLADLDAHAGIRATARQLQAAGAELHGVIPSDDALIPAGARRQTAAALRGGLPKRRLKSAMNSGRYAWAASTVVMPGTRNSLTRRSCSVAQRRSIRPLACGEWAAM